MLLSHVYTRRLHRFLLVLVQTIQSPFRQH